MSIDQARLEKAREIAATCCEAEGLRGDARAIREAKYDSIAIVQSALAALTLCNWQPPEDPDERAAWAFWSVEWDRRHDSPIYRLALAAYKAGKAAR